MYARVKRFLHPSDSRTLLRRLFWVGFVVRVLYMTLSHSYRMRPIDDHFQFGWEMGRIGRALATGFGYADPFTGHSGPTAWTPPLYPLLIAGVFRLFGVYTLKSAWVLLALNSVFSAATAPVIYLIALRCFRNGASQPGIAPPDASSIALWSAWLWALYPAAMQYAVRWVWDMSVTAFLFSAAFLLALRLRGIGEVPAPRRADRTDWLLFGVLWGLIALSNSSLLLFLPACLLWIVWLSLQARNWSRLATEARGALLAAVCCVAIVSPWIVRNWQAFHAFVPMRTNLGAELYESADPLNEGFPNVATLPLAEATPQFRHYRQLGELAYSREQGLRARALIRAQPALFLAHAAQRVYFFWISVPHPADTPGSLFGEILRRFDYAFISLAGLLGLGLALRRHQPAAWLFTWAFLLLPLIYYFVTVQARFRHPLEPLITVLAVYLFQSADRARSGP